MGDLMFRFQFAVLAALAFTACSTPPPPAKPTAAQIEAKKYPAPPTIFSHTMTRAHSSREDRVRYSPEAVFQVQNCEGCLFIYDETSVTENGQVFENPGVARARLTSEESIANRFGTFQGGSLTTETGWASADVVKFCYHNLRLCKSEDPASCTALAPRLRYELDLESGHLNTNLPITDPNLREPASVAKKFHSICPPLKKSAGANKK